MNTIRFESILGAGVDENKKLVHVLLRDTTGQVISVEFPEGMIGGMTLAIIDQLRTLQEANKHATSTEGQLTALTDVRGVLLPDGRRGLAMTFEDAMRVISAVSTDMRRQLGRELDTLDRLSTSEPKPGRDRH